MRTSLIETAQIENWLLQDGDLSDRLVIEAKMLSSSEMKEKVQWQSATFDLARLYGRQKLHDEIKAVEQRLFHTSKYRSFQERIRSIFKK